jgi:hypothetical protein
MKHRHRGPRPGKARAEEAEVQQPDTTGWVEELNAIATNPERWPELSEDSLLLVVFQQCLYFAHTGEGDSASVLAELYSHMAARVEVQDRLELLDRVTSAVEESGTPLAALLPFLQHEPDPAVVTLAATAYATLSPLENDDPLSGPRTVLRMAEHAEDEGTRVGLLAGVLELGDRRTLPILREAWATLSGASRIRLAGQPASSPLVFASMVEFWADALADAGGDDVAAAMLGALARLAREAEPQRVLDVRRKLPANAADDRETIEIVEDVPLAKFGARIAPRLAALAGRPALVEPLAAARVAWEVPHSA